MWLPWYVAAPIALGLAGGAVALRHDGRSRVAQVRAATQELSLVFGLYGLWRLAHVISSLSGEQAFARGQRIVELERTLHLPSEAALQRLVLPHGWLVQASNGYYAIVHVPAVIVLLAVAWFTDRDRYPAIRTTLAVGTGLCFLLELVPVAPPRLLPNLGFVDTGILYHQSVYGPPGAGVSNQLSAMPSLHVAWAVLVGVGALSLGRSTPGRRSRWRWLGPAHTVATVFVVAATGNHFWMDGVVGAALFGLAYLAQRAVRRMWRRRRRGSPGGGGAAVGPDASRVTVAA